MGQMSNRVKGWLKSSLPWQLLVLLGVVLRLRLYAASYSLWADEASLAYNIANRSFFQLTQLLDYHQAAPIGFLFIGKLLIVIMGNHDYVMRLFPLISGILALFLVHRTARRYFGAAGLLAVGLLAFSTWLIYYSSELKQYSSDVMAAALLVFLAGRCLGENSRGRDFLLMGAIGALIIWVSHPSVFVLAGIGMALLYEKMSQKRNIPFSWLFGIGLVWALSFGLEYYISLRHIVADEYLIDYWSKTYMPMPPWNNLGWYEKTFSSFLFISLHRSDWILSTIFLLLAGIGALTLILNNRTMALIILSPFVMALVASALQRYPLQYRFMLFLTPFAFLLMASGLHGLYAFVSRWNRFLALTSCILLAFASLWMASPTSFSVFMEPGERDIKPALQYIAENRAAEDTIYVFHAADPVFAYYAPFYGLDAGDIVIGFDTPRKKRALEGFYDDVSALQGKEKVWFLFSEIVDCPGCESDQQAFYVEYLNNFGIMLDSFDGSGGNVYLYAMDP